MMPLLKSPASFPVLLNSCGCLKALYCCQCTLHGNLNVFSYDCLKFYLCGAMVEMVERQVFDLVYSNLSCDECVSLCCTAATQVISPLSRALEVTEEELCIDRLGVRKDVLKSEVHFLRVLPIAIILNKGRGHVTYGDCCLRIFFIITL